MKTVKAVISVIGKDALGIIHKVSEKCVEADANIVDISQSVMKEFFSMVMVVDITALKVPFVEFVDTLKVLGEEKRAKAAKAAQASGGMTCGPDGCELHF
jgi:ACT domain-containing protein